MKLVKGPLLFVVACIIIGSTTLVLAKNGDNHMDKFLLVFLARYFYYVAEMRNYSHRQYAFLTVLTEEEAHWNTPVIFQPPIVFPTCNHTLTPANRKEYGNHLAAIPKHRSKPKIHTEEQFLDRLDDLIAAFQRNGSKVAVIVLYTYRAPCQECTLRIVAYFRSRPQVCRNVIVVYTKDTGHNINVSYAEQMLHENGITLHQIGQSDFNFPSNIPEESAAVLDFESFVENVLEVSDHDSMFDSHDRCDMKNEDEELWKEEKSRKKSKEHLSNEDEESQCRTELNDHIPNEEEDEMGDEWGEMGEFWNIDFTGHTSDDRYKMENMEEEEDDEEWGEEGKFWNIDFTGHTSDDRYKMENMEEEEDDEEWGEEGKFWNLNFKGHTSDGRYKMENTEEEKEIEGR